MARTQTDKVLNEVSGQVWLDEALWDLVRADVRLMQPVSFYGGLGVARRLTIVYEAQLVDGHVWFPSQFDMEVDGRRLFSQIRTRLASLFVVMQTIELDGDGGELHEGEVAVFVGRNHVISVRRGTKQGFVNVRARVEEEPELLQHGPAYVLYVLMDAIVDRYFPVVDVLTEEVERLEETIFAGQTTRANIAELYGLKRKLARFERTSVSLLEVTGKLHGGRVPPSCFNLQDYFRDVHDHLLRLEQSLGHLREMVSTAISVNLSLITLQENEVVKRLAAYASLVAVPTLIAGIYGMNFDYMPELRMRWGYPMVLLLMVAIDVYLAYRFKKANWF